MTWREAVITALHRYAKKHSTKNITREGLINEELAAIIHQISSVGKTPRQTLSRVLQELRDDGVLYFTSSGNYLLVDQNIELSNEDLPDDAIDFALKNNKLVIGNLPTRESKAEARYRHGQSRIRQLTLENYSSNCALCDIRSTDLLISSHIARWADDPTGRGDLSNVICLCCFHDTLFEKGYISLSDDLRILRKDSPSNMLNSIFLATNDFKPPKHFEPTARYLRQHRQRTGFSEL